MNVILFSKEDLLPSEERIRLTGRRHKHVLEVLKASIGDELCVGLIGGKLGNGRITAIDKMELEMEISLDRDPPAPISINLVLALPRPIVLKRLLYHIAALGIKKITLIHSDRVEKSYWKSPVLTSENVKDQLILGLEQARDTIVPEVSFRKDFSSFLDKEFPGLANGTHAFIADPEASESCPIGNDTPATLVIGPEGGFIPYETGRFKAAGCVSVRFGRRVLRVETAVIAAIARLARW